MPQEPLEPIAGLVCPKCQAAQVAESPPNAISPDRGFTCLSRGAKLRGTTTLYLVAIVITLGLLVAASGLVTIYGDDRDAKIPSYVRGPFWSLIPLYLLVLAYSVCQLLKPRPRRTT